MTFAPEDGRRVGSDAASETTALFVARVWLQGDPPRLTGRISYTEDVSGPERVAIVASGPEDVMEALRHWLERAAGRGDGRVTES